MKFNRKYIIERNTTVRSNNRCGTSILYSFFSYLAPGLVIQMKIEKNKTSFTVLTKDQKRFDMLKFSLNFIKDIVYACVVAEKSFTSLLYFL